MSRWLRAAGLLPSDKTDRTDKTHATIAREGVNARDRGVLSVKSVLSPGERAEPPGPPPEAGAALRHALAAPSRHPPETFPHGVACGGSPRTWTGRIVSLAEWRGLSEWDRHGPNGRLFCGACGEWVMPGTCAHTGARSPPERML